MRKKRPGPSDLQKLAEMSEFAMSTTVHTRVMMLVVPLAEADRSSNVLCPLLATYDPLQRMLEWQRELGIPDTRSVVLAADIPVILFASGTHPCVVCM